MIKKKGNKPMKKFITFIIIIFLILGISTVNAEVKYKNNKTVWYGVSDEMKEDILRSDIFCVSGTIVGTFDDFINGIQNNFQKGEVSLTQIGNLSEDSGLITFEVFVNTTPETINFLGAVFKFAYMPSFLIYTTCDSSSLGSDDNSVCDEIDDEVKLILYEGEMSIDDPKIINTMDEDMYNLLFNKVYDQLVRYQN